MIARAMGRLLCRVGRHRWGRVREITDVELDAAVARRLDLDSAGYFDFVGKVHGDRYVSRCLRAGCRAEEGP